MSICPAAPNPCGAAALRPKRTWIEEGNYWVTCVASPQDTRAVTEVACDTCMADAFETFRTQFPGLYASGAGHSTALAARHE